MVMYLLTLLISIVDPSTQRSGWSSLVVTQPIKYWSPTSVCVCVLLCQVFIIAARLGNEVIFYQLSPLTLQVTVNSAIMDIEHSQK